jgi:hypothetical protein
MPMSRTPKIRNPIPRERSTKIVPHVMNAEDLVEKKWWIHLSRSESTTATKEPSWFAAGRSPWSPELGL